MTAHQARAECLLAWLARADDTGTHHAAHQYRKEERHHQESAKCNHQCACRPIHDRFLANTLVGRSHHSVAATNSSGKPSIIVITRPFCMGVAMNITRA